MTNVASDLNKVNNPVNLELLLNEELHNEINSEYKTNVIYHAACILKKK